MAEQGTAPAQERAAVLNGAAVLTAVKGGKVVPKRGEPVKGVLDEDEDMIYIGFRKDHFVKALSATASSVEKGTPVYGAEVRVSAGDVQLTLDDGTVGMFTLTPSWKGQWFSIGASADAK